jgi:hypothetical protein
MAENRYACIAATGVIRAWRQVFVLAATLDSMNVVHE